MTGHKDITQYKLIDKEVYERDLHVKKYVLEQLNEVNNELGTWMEEILSEEVAAKVNLPLYRKIKDIREKIRSVL
jgi:hypothetical protein